MSLTKARKRIAVSVFAPLLLGLLVAGSVSAQQAEPADAKAEVKQTEKKKRKPAAKPRGRLPNFYNKVVSETQRVKIYDIQKKYNAQIEELQAQLKALLAKRDAEVEAVLTPEQREKVAAIAAEAKTKRKSPKKSKKDAAASQTK